RDGVVGRFLGLGRCRRRADGRSPQRQGEQHGGGHPGQGQRLPAPGRPQDARRGRRGRGRRGRGHGRGRQGGVAAQRQVGVQAEIGQVQVAGGGVLAEQDRQTVLLFGRGRAVQQRGQQGVQFPLSRAVHDLS